MSRLKPRSQLPRSAERGIALLIVLATLALVTSVVTEFQFNSRVDLQLAFNARDNLQAEYNALSALRLRALLLKHARKIDAAMGGMAAAVGIDKSAMPPIGQMLEMIPIDCGFMSAIIKEADVAALEDGESEGGIFNGECSATSQSEHSKISLTALAKSGSNRQAMQLLLGLLSNPAFERHFDEDDRNGTHAETPVELLNAIVDWVDQNENQTGNQVADEDRHYAYLKTPYRAKNGPFDSLRELQMVHGVDDELYDLLAENVSIYNDSPQMELATSPKKRIWIGILASVPDGVNAMELLTHPGVLLLAQMLEEMTTLGGPGFGSLKVAGLGALVDQAGLGGLIDTQSLRKAFTDKTSSTWYTIEAEGRVGNATRRITAVFQASEGLFYHIRLE